jgi:hypothetical protein
MLACTSFTDSTERYSSSAWSCEKRVSPAHTDGCSPCPTTPVSEATSFLHGQTVNAISYHINIFMIVQTLIILISKRKLKVATIKR